MPPGNWVTKAPPPRPQNAWRKIPFGIRLRLSIGALIVVAIVLATAFPPFPPQGTRAVGMSPGTWQNGVLYVSLSEVHNVSDLLPSYLGYEISYHGSYLFRGPAGSYDPGSGVTVTIAYDDSDGNNRVSLNDGFSITVTPHSYTDIHGRGLSLRNQGSQIGYLQLP